MSYRKRLELAEKDGNNALCKKLDSQIISVKAKISKLEKQEHKFTVSGKQMKGGALFIGASKHYLKDVRDNDGLTEWRGGKLLIVLDEGILNTENYSGLREFLKKYFYIKAIVSLGRDTFVPVSNTTTKTSILYAIKKDDVQASQEEPIFFAHAEKTGIDTRGKVCPNHLNDILSKYFEFKKNVLAAYSGSHFSKEKFMKQRSRGDDIDRS